MASEAFNQIMTLLDSLDQSEKLDLINRVTDYLRSGKNTEALTPELEDDEPPEKNTARVNMPKVAQMLEWKVLQIGDRLFIRGREKQAVMLLNKNEVVYDGYKMRINDWAKKVTGHRAVNIYRDVICERLQKPLWEIRRDAMLANGLDYQE